MRHNRHIYAIVPWVIAIFFGVAIMLSSSRDGRAKAKYPATEPSLSREAGINDIKVGVIVDKRNFTTVQKPHRAAIVAFVSNVSQVNIDVSFMGLTGPIIASVGPLKGIPFELRSEPLKAGFITLQPNEMIARSFMVDDPLDDARLSAYYTVYASGHLGQSDQISAIVYSDGKITKVPNH